MQVIPAQKNLRLSSSGLLLTESWNVDFNFQNHSRSGREEFTRLVHESLLKEVIGREVLSNLSDDTYICSRLEVKCA